MALIVGWPSEDRGYCKHTLELASSLCRMVNAYSFSLNFYDLTYLRLTEVKIAPNLLAVSSGVQSSGNWGVPWLKLLSSSF
jgi:hypothetical protein